MYFERTNFLIVGMSGSGRAACRLLLGYNAKVAIFDENPSAEVKKTMKVLEESGAVVVGNDGINAAVGNADVIVLSPGVPVDNKIPALAAEKGKCVTGELELGYLVSRCPIVAITGTNGKTTTCSLVYEILQKAGVNSVLAGNVGVPFTSVVGNCDEKTVAVLEVSSFQLETTRKLTPHIACILNITPDHLNRHYNMDNYVYLKSKLLSGLGESEYAVLSADDDIVRRLGENTRAKKVYFSVSKQTNGAYVSDGKIFWRGKEIMQMSDLKLKGIHNAENALAAVCIAKILGVDDKQVALAISQFAGVKHRQEKIGEKDGIVFIDDSKATNPDSALKAVESCGKSLVLLVGGIDKGFGYNDFFIKVAESGNVRALVVYGQSRKELYRAAESAGIDDIYLSVGFDSAVKTAFDIAKKGDTVLLSPACSSFDEFSGFEERGNAYATLVRDFAGVSKSGAEKEYSSDGEAEKVSRRDDFCAELTVASDGSGRINDDEPDDE